MNPEMPHLPDEQLLLIVDGELPQRAAEAATRHLDGCGSCRRRLEQIEASASEFGRAYHQDLVTRTPTSKPLRQALEARLTDIEHKTAPSWAVACAILAAVVLGVEFLSSRSGPSPAAGDPHTGPRPIAYLTPGATRAVTANDLCGIDPARPRSISPRVRQAVLRDYSMELVSARDYELDYLITPELGGSDDRRNLWPERYSSDVWNARVKDELERLLPKLVCAGTVPLATAQRDMATDWIAAYQKYFQTDRPLHIYSSPDTPDDAPELPGLSFELPTPRSDHRER
jgi:hypothetical protein